MYDSISHTFVGDEGWEKASDLVLNRRVSEAPGVTMFATSKEDVIAAVKFSKEHNMNLKVISSGQFCYLYNIRIQFVKAAQSDVTLAQTCQLIFHFEIEQ